MSVAARSTLQMFALFWRVKFSLARNYLGRIKRHIFAQAILVCSAMAIMLVGGYFLFEFIFAFLRHDDQIPFGLPLSKRLVGMVLLAFFSMLIFSNLIITLTTTYISREVEFYMGQPIGHRTLFFCKLTESTLYSSWAFIILSMPFFIALGGASGEPVPWVFYPVTALLLAPFITIPSALGSTLALLITTYLPAKKMFKLAVGLAGISLLLATTLGRYSGMVRLGGASSRSQISRVMNFMGVGDIAWMPSTWLARGIRAAAAADWPEVLFWGALLLSTALVTLEICYWLAGPLYYAGYSDSHTSGTAERTSSGGLYGFFDWLARPLRPPIRALVTKELAIFWRDPAQWGQLMVLFGLLFIYIINLGSASEMSRIQINSPVWQSLISLGNIGAVCFVLSILSTRSFYPLLSLEGKQQWVIGLAPLGRTQLVWTKYGVCGAGSLALTVPLTLLSCVMIRADPFVTILSLVTILVMSMGLNSLAIGLGALLPNFQEDNPARIANGLGGTINVICSLIYIGGTVVLETPLVGAYISGSMPSAGPGRFLFYASFPAWLLLQASAIVIPMRLGIRHWKRLEF